MKRGLPVLLAVSFVLMMLSACAGKASEPTAAESAAPSEVKTVTFTDSAGRAVDVPLEITKIAVSGPLAQIVVFALAPDKMVGIATNWDETAVKYLDPKHYNLPVIGQLYGTKGELNLEELLKADPDVVIDVGEPKESIAQDMDALQEQTGIPFVHISANTATMGDTYRNLGKLLGMETEAEKLASYCEDTYAMMQDVMNKVGEENKVSLMYCMGDAGLNVVAKSSYHAEVLDMMSKNVAVVDEPSSKGTGNEVDMEQLLKWNPEVLIFAQNSVFDSVGSDATWKQLSAVSNGRYYKVPFGPYNWLGFPASVQRYLGMMWLGKLLYPEQADYDLFEKTSEFYKLFVHCDLTQAQYDELMANAK